MSTSRKAAGALLAAVAALIATSAPPAFAAGYITLTGGGAGSGSAWDISYGSTESTCYDSESYAMYVAEGTLDPDGVSAIGYKDDAYDGMAAVYVGGTGYDPTSGTTTTSAFTGATESLDGLDVTVTLTALPSSATLRQVVTLYNAGASEVSTTVGWAGNLGSDSPTYIIATGNGDTTFSGADTYLVTADSDTTPGDPVSTIVFYGSNGSPAATSSGPVSNCDASSVNTGNDDVSAEYAVTVPAGATRYLVVFLQMDQTIAEATAAAPQIAAAKANSKLFRGLSHKMLMNIVNWDFARARK